MISMPMVTNRCHPMHAAFVDAYEWDFYDALAAFLRVADFIQRHHSAQLKPCLPYAQGYLNVALKHMPELCEYDFFEAATTREFALQLRAAHLLRKSAVLSGLWLKKQLVVECARLFEHSANTLLHENLPGEMRMIALVAQSRAANPRND